MESAGEALKQVSPMKIGDYEFTGKPKELVPPDEFVEELVNFNKNLRQEHVVARVRAFMDRSTEDVWFRYVAQSWAIESKILDAMALQIIAVPSWGLDNHSLKYSLIRRFGDEAKHAKLWEDLCLKKGWIKSRKDIYSHPYFRAVPEWQSYISWLHTASGYPMPVMFAAGTITGEGNQIAVFKELAAKMNDPEIRSVLLINLFDESMHFNLGKYYIKKYAITPELQELCRWAAAMGTWLTTSGAKAIYKFCMDDYP